MQGAFEGETFNCWIVISPEPPKPEKVISTVWPSQLSLKEIGAPVVAVSVSTYPSISNTPNSLK